MAPSRKTWAKKLKAWRKKNEEFYAKALLSPPKEVTLLKAVPFPGLSIIMGDIGTGKTGLACEVAALFHKKKGLPAVLHLPKASDKARRKIQRLVPKWMKVTKEISEWPHNCMIIVDEASQSVHARRSQSMDNLEVDSLLGICRQRKQSILFVAHHSRKIDIEVVRAVHRILYKQPTHAHGFFERDELTDFTWRAIEFFAGQQTERAKLRATLVIDFRNFSITQCKNGLPDWWCTEISELFKEANGKKKKGGK